MCPACLAASGLYVAGGVSAGAVTTFVAARLLRKPAKPLLSKHVIPRQFDAEESRGISR